MLRLPLIGKILLVLAVIMLAAALVSLIHTNSGIVRMLDFVREPSIYLAALLAILALIFAGSGRWLVIGVLLASAGINLYRMWPYSALASAEIPMPDDVDGMSCVRVLSLNVLQENDQHDRVARLIEREDPDLLLLMETDQAWIDALEPQLSRYGYRLEKPLDNTYGMAFATRLQVDRAEMVSNTDANTPTLYATMRTPDGARFEMIGLHPRPPRPKESTKLRDEKIARAAARTPDHLGNVLAIGDFNDVPWSRTTQKLVKRGDYFDPRVGRGTFATFPENWALLGWPLDQLFVKNGVKVERFRILPNVGSDHLPLAADVCVNPAGTSGANDRSDAALLEVEGE